MKPVCFKCHRFYRMIKLGYYFIEGMPKENGAQPGIEHAASWQPYKIWSGDLWKCMGCGNEIISGTGLAPVSERHLPTFNDTMEKTNAQRFTVYDC